MPTLLPPHMIYMYNLDRVFVTKQLAAPTVLYLLASIQQWGVSKKEELFLFVGSSKRMPKARAANVYAFRRVYI